MRNLHPPAKLLDEDISKINRIFWVDDRPESVRSLMGALNYHQVPTHFVAFMPLELEQELFELEKKFAGRSEDQIDSTTFRVVRSGNRYKPVVSARKGWRPAQNEVGWHALRYSEGRAELRLRDARPSEYLRACHPA